MGVRAQTGPNFGQEPNRVCHIHPRLPGRMEMEDPRLHCYLDNGKRIQRSEYEHARCIASAPTY
jgi:hypothetical protein